MTETGGDGEPGADDSEGALGGSGRQRTLPREDSGMGGGGGAPSGASGGRSLRRTGSSMVRRNSATAVPFAPPPDIEPLRESPAVQAARSGRTMLRQVGFGGEGDLCCVFVVGSLVMACGVRG